LREAGISIEGLRSKSWDEFGVKGAPSMDLIITVCDNAAAEVCPIWPGHPATAHWSYADPSAVTADEDAKRAAFQKTLGLIRQRLTQFVSLPDDALSPGMIQRSARSLAED
jgi:protein-tyrosine-phosphatase